MWNLKKLAMIRERAGLTQEEVAGRAKLDRSTITRLENNKGNPRLETLAVVLKACGSTFAELFSSNVPRLYDRPEDQALHEKLQIILEEGSARDREVAESVLDTLSRGPSPSDPNEG